MFFLLCFFLYSSSQAADLRRFTHEDPALRLRQNKLWLSLPLSVDNEDRLSDMLRDGTSVELRLAAQIARKRRFWFNAGLGEVEFLSILKYDPLGREFRLTMPGQARPLHDPLLRRLLALSWKTLNLPLLEDTLLEAGENYLIELDLTLKQIELPPWLDRTLILWNREVVESEHLTLDYTVPHVLP